MSSQSKTGTNVVIDSILQVVGTVLQSNFALTFFFMAIYAYLRSHWRRL